MDEKYAAMMKNWIDSAKSCSQLATAAMFLPVFYIRELVAIGKDTPLIVSINDSFLYSWIAFIVAIAFSQTYQITATKLISVGGNFSIPLFPRTQYWVMVGALIAGLFFFTDGALHTKPETVLPVAPQASAPK